MDFNLGVSGYGQVAVICGLIVLEELGVPMPFAPGDLLLVLVGVSIATAHVNPFVVLPATVAVAAALTWRAFNNTRPTCSGAQG